MLHKRIAILILFCLIITNIIWFFISIYPGPFIGLIFYGVITFLFGRKSHFKAGVVGGVIGLGIHIYEFLFQSLSEFSGFESGLFFINLILPIPLIFFSYKTYIVIEKNNYKNNL